MMHHVVGVQEGISISMARAMCKPQNIKQHNHSAPLKNWELAEYKDEAGDIDSSAAAVCAKPKGTWCEPASGPAEWETKRSYC